MNHSAAGTRQRVGASRSSLDEVVLQTPVLHVQGSRGLATDDNGDKEGREKRERESHDGGSGRSVLVWLRSGRMGGLP